MNATSRHLLVVVVFGPRRRRTWLRTQPCYGPVPCTSVVPDLIAVCPQSISDKTKRQSKGGARRAAKEYYENMLKVCDGESPADIPAKLAGADIDAALCGVRELEPAAEKFYLTLDDDQKIQANPFLDSPGR